MVLLKVGYIIILKCWFRNVNFVNNVLVCCNEDGLDTCIECEFLISVVTYDMYSG